MTLSKKEEARKQIDLCEFVGEMGIYQWRVFITIFVFAMFTVDSIHIVFIGADMDHWCRVEELQGLPADVQKQLSIPVMTSVVDGGGSVVEYSRCEMYSSNYSYLLLYNDTELLTNDTRSVVSCTQGWNYDTSTFQSTIVNKFNLVCGWGFLRQFVSTVFMGGFLVGAVTSGVISDRYGRKKTMLVFSLVKVTGIFLSVFSPLYTMFVAGRFLMGFGQVGYFLPSFVLVMELVGRKYRPALGTALQIAFSIGYMLQPAIAYFLRDEFRYQIAATAPNLIFPIFIILVIPESPRWLAVHGKFDEIKTFVEKVCRTNGRPVPTNFDPTCLLEQSTTVKRTKNCSALLTSPVMRIRTLVIDFSWFTCSLIYYALAFNVGTLHGDIYLNTFISGAGEIPAYIICIFMMDWKMLGRRWTGCVGLVGAGISSFLCIPMILMHYVEVTTILAMFGKAFICITYSVVYVYASEIFPTEVRNIGVGTASMCARISSMSAHYVGGPLSDVWKPLPSLLFGIFATVSGASYTLLPETLGQQLPDTIEQAEKFQRSASVISVSLTETHQASSNNGSHGGQNQPLHSHVNGNGNSVTADKTPHENGCRETLLTKV